jgi:hypothetical protein
MKQNNTPSKNKFRLKDKAMISASFGLLALGMVLTGYQIKKRQNPMFSLALWGAGNLSVACSIVKARENAKQK